MKEEIIRILQSDEPAFIRFELLEALVDYADGEEDVRLMLSILRHDKDPMIRHEVAAQLLRLEQTKPELMYLLKKTILALLKETVVNDESVIVKHEALEAIGYIGEQEELNFLLSYTRDLNEDIRTTSQVAYESLRYRIDNNIGASELSSYLLNPKTEFIDL